MVNLFDSSMIPPSLASPSIRQQGSRDCVQLSLRLPPPRKAGITPGQRQYNYPVDHLLDRLADVEEGEHGVEHAEDQRAQNRPRIAAHAAKDRGAADHRRGNRQKEKGFLRRI